VAAYLKVANFDMEPASNAHGEGSFHIPRRLSGELRVRGYVAWDTLSKCDPESSHDNINENPSSTQQNCSIFVVFVKNSKTTVKRAMCQCQVQNESCFYKQNGIQAKLHKFPNCSLGNESRDSTVGIGTGYELNDQGVGVRVPVGQEENRLDLFCGPPSLLSKGIPGDLSPGVKQPGREADHSPPTSAEDKKRGSIYPLPHASSWRSA
jgi:hypothetical protein